MKIKVLNNARSFFTGRLNERATGRLQVLFSALGFGAIGTLAKLAYSSGMDSPTLLALRFAVAAAALWAYLLLFKRKALRIGGKELATCAALGLAGYGIFSSLVFKALETIPASMAGLLYFSYPLFVMLLDWLLTKERPERQLTLGALMILCGISVGVIGTIGGGLNIGVPLALGGAAWYAAYVVSSRRLLNELRPQTVALYVTTFAAIAFWLMGGGVIPALSVLTTQNWMIVLAISLVSTVMALLSFFAGLEKLGSTEASQVGTFELIVGLALAVYVLGEPVNGGVLLGALFIVGGLVMGQIKPSPRPEPCADC